MMKRNPRKSYVAASVLAGAALYWVLHLSAGDRGPIDWVVITLVGLAIAWNVFRLSQRLAVLGGAAVWHVQRTALFWIIGLLNTVFRRPDAQADWKLAVGVVVLVLALADTVALYRKERQVVPLTGEPAGSTGGS